MNMYNPLMFSFNGYHENMPQYMKYVYQIHDNPENTYIFAIIASTLS